MEKVEEMRSILRTGVAQQSFTPTMVQHTAVRLLIIDVPHTVQTGQTTHATR